MADLMGDVYFPLVLYRHRCPRGAWRRVVAQYYLPDVLCSRVHFPALYEAAAFYERYAVDAAGNEKDSGKIQGS